MLFNRQASHQQPVFSAARLIQDGPKLSIGFTAAKYSFSRACSGFALPVHAMLSHAFASTKKAAPRR
jgi:hypothetical protein